MIISFGMIQVLVLCSTFVSPLTILSMAHFICSKLQVNHLDFRYKSFTRNNQESLPGIPSEVILNQFISSPSLISFAHEVQTKVDFLSRIAGDNLSPPEE